MFGYKTLLYKLDQEKVNKQYSSKFDIKALSYLRGASFTSLQRFYNELC